MSNSISVFNFNDYRLFLREQFEEIRNEKPFFSHRFIAGKLNYKSTGAISLILNGRKNISIEKALQISEFINLSKEEAEFFQLLVQFNQAKSENEKNHFYLKLSKFEKSQFSKINHNQYDFFNEWYHSVIREIVGVYPDITSTKEICRILKPRVTEAQAEKSLRLLTNLGFIEKKSNGSYSRCDQVLTTGNTIDSSILKKYNYDMIRLALNVNDKDKAGDRMLSSLMLGVSEKTYFKMIDEIRDLRKKLLKMAKDDKNAERVFQFNFQTFPLTKRT